MEAVYPGGFPANPPAAAAWLAVRDDGGALRRVLTVLARGVAHGARVRVRGFRTPAGDLVGVAEPAPAGSSP